MAKIKSVTRAEGVLLRFYDPHSRDNGWRTMKAAGQEEPTLCEIMGYVVNITDKVIVLAMGHSGQDVTLTFTIPLGCVVSVHSVRLGEARTLNADAL